MIKESVRCCLQMSTIISLVVMAAFFSPTPALAGGVVGNGTPGSCNEAAFNTALAGGGSITFNCGGVKTISFTSYKEIQANTTVDGSGLITLSGSNSYLFQVFFGQTLTLQNITLADGLSNVTGAVENFGTTNIINSRLKNNRSTNNGGAVLNYGTLNLVNTIVSNNQAVNNGGSIHIESGSLIVSNSQFSSNQVSGAGGKGGAIYLNTGSSAVISATLISSNTSAGNGGGIYSEATLSLTNVTLSGNRANSNGGGGVYQVGGNATLNFVTVANNTASAFGGGVYNDAAGTMNLRNTLLANNSVGNCDGVVGSLGHNLSSDSNCSNFTQTGDQQNVSLPLGLLEYNGGPTYTHMPLTGNPAIEGGICVGGITTDQRGFARPYNPQCDVGAVEVRPIPVYLPLITKNL